MPPKLTLFHYPSCPFCYRVASALRTLGVEAESRNIHKDRDAMSELVQARGRATVPVLKIIEPDGTERWLPESAAIIEYLRDLA